MISTPMLRSKILDSHTRSSSFPSRKSQLLIGQYLLHTPKPNNNNPTSLSSLSSICGNFHNLENLHKCVDDLLLSPHTHHIFARERHEKWVDEILDGYLSLVDACAMAKDFVMHSKECVLNLLSVLRRRRDSDDQLCKLMSSRKIMKKKIQKSLRNIISFKNKSSVSVTGNKDQEIVAIISILKEAESATLDLFQALLLSIIGAKGHSRPNIRFLLISRLVREKISCQENKSKTLEFGDLDAALFNFRTSKCESGTQIKELQQQLTDMDSLIQVVEEKLECLFKRLIKSRVLLLNIQCQL